MHSQSENFPVTKFVYTFPLFCAILKRSEFFSQVKEMTL